MARIVRNAKLDTRSARAGLRQRRSPYWAAISPGFALGYRKGPKGGVWLAKLVIPSLRQETTIGPADDALDPDGVHILNYAQAQDKARQWKARIEATGGGHKKPKTVREAVDSYETDLKARGGDVANVGRLRAHVADDLLDKAVAALSRTELRKWRDGLVKASPKRRKTKAVSPGAKPVKLSPATINRTCTVFKAVLNHIAADPDQHIGNKQAWEGGLESLRDAERSRNVILVDTVVRQIIDEAYNHSAEFGLLVEIAAVTGARYGQLGRLAVADLQADGAEPRLMMPSSRKGKKGVTKASDHPAPIPVELAKRLQALTRGRAPTAPLLTKPIIGNWRGGPWKKSDHGRLFDDVVEPCGLADWEERGYRAKVTIYALRHSSIVRQIKANVPIRIVAVNHDTSVEKIESNYSRDIGDYTDAITRAALLDTSRPIARNVVPIRG